MIDYETYINNQATKVRRLQKKADKTNSLADRLNASNEFENPSVVGWLLAMFEKAQKGA